MNKEVFDVYREATPDSKALHDRATAVMPGGDTRSVTYYEPYPAYVESARGATLTTTDGEQLLDVLNNYTQTVLGHSPPAVVDAICERLHSGNGLAAPNESIVELAERLVERTPSIEHVRFGNSGTEATMNAIRAAIGWTGNERVCKIHGGYHGTHDTVEVAVSGDGREHRGIPTVVEDRVETVRFNDTESLKRRFEASGDDLACLIMEPVLGVGGMVPATDEFLRTARDLTNETETLLIFDEVMTYRLAPGGAQERRDVTPDLTALGKLIGGGLPVGAFGGRRDVMHQFHPTDGTIDHSGTFNGNPATMTGGVATLDQLDAKAIATLNERGDELRDRLDRVGADSRHPVQVTGDGSLFQIHFTDERVTDVETSTAGEPPLHDLFFALRAEGVFLAPRGMGNLSTAIEPSDIDAVTEAFERALERLDVD